GMVFSVRLRHAVSELCIHEKKSILQVVAQRVTIATIIKTAKIAQKIFDLRVLWFIAERVVSNRFCTTNVVNANHQRFEVLNHSHGSDIRIDQANGYQGHRQEGDFQIRIRDNRVSELLRIELLRGI